MHVSVYHNVAPDIATRMIWGYEPGHPLVHVLETDVGPDHVSETRAADVDELAEWIWTACNIDLDVDMPPGLHVVASAYRDCGLRSLSVGDVVAIGEGDDRVMLKVDGAGFSAIDSPLNLVTEHQHGTRPWTAGAGQ